MVLKEYHIYVAYNLYMLL